MAENAIFAVSSNAGVALVSWTHGATPCPHCLISRLSEAGFEPEPSPSCVDRATINPSVAAGLIREAQGRAPVALIRGANATVHWLLPYPNCPGCAAGQELLRVGARLPSAMLRDPLTGITSCLERRDPALDKTTLCCAVTGRVHVPLTEKPLYSVGAGPDMRSAAMAQLGESVERYSAFHPVLSRLVRARAADLGGQAAPVSLFSGYDARQLSLTGYRRLRPDDELAWVEGRSLASGEKAMVPAALVFLHAAWPPEVRFGPMLSTGTACARSLAQARLKGMLEVIERYRVLAAWNRGVFGKRLPLSIIRPPHSDLAFCLRTRRFTLALRALSLPPAAPVVMAALAGPRFPWLACGSAAGLSVGVAAAKAVEEAAHAYQVLGGWQGEVPRPGTLAAVAPAEQHMLLWASRQRSRKLIEVFTANPPGRAPGADRVSAAAVRRELLGLCPQAVEIVLTPPDCRLCGMEVVKLVAPGLPTLSFGRAGAPALHLAAHGIPRTRKPHPLG